MAGSSSNGSSHGSGRSRRGGRFWRSVRGGSLIVGDDAGRLTRASGRMVAMTGDQIVIRIYREVMDFGCRGRCSADIHLMVYPKGQYAARWSAIGVGMVRRTSADGCCMRLATGAVGWTGSGRRCADGGLIVHRWPCDACRPRATNHLFITLDGEHRHTPSGIPCRLWPERMLE